MAKTTANCPTDNASPRSRLRNYVVRFTDWTAYRLDVEARNEAGKIGEPKTMDVLLRDENVKEFFETLGNRTDTASELLIRRRTQSIDGNKRNLAACSLFDET